MSNLWKSVYRFAMILIGLWAGVNVYNNFFSKGPDVTPEDLIEYWENKDFKTDSQKVYIDYSQIPFDKLVNYVPPAIHIEYIDSTRTNNNQYLTMDDSLVMVIDSLEGVVAEISKDFLLMYPHSKKLIQALFDKDTILFDLLTTQGEIERQVYPVNFSRFKYQYTTDGEFRAEVLPLPNSQQPFFHDHSFYLNGGYEITHNAPIVGVLGTTSILKRWALFADGYVVIEERPSIFVKGTLGYNLWRGKQ